MSPATASPTRRRQRQRRLPRPGQQSEQEHHERRDHRGRVAFRRRTPIAHEGGERADDDPDRGNSRDRGGNEARDYRDEPAERADQRGIAHAGYRVPSASSRCLQPRSMPINRPAAAACEQR